jgi:alkylation response protein AidB-like acyl-CoA dehydrogenase
MESQLTQEQRTYYQEFCEFVDQEVIPHAGEWDKNQEIPDEVLTLLGEKGYLGGVLPKENGGGGWDFVTFGLLNEAFGAGCSSLNALFTVQTMVSMTLLRWGTDEQKAKWLEPMAKGDVIGAFAMTEPDYGSDIQAIQTEFTQQGEHYLLNGKKKWITFSAKADLLLVFGKLKGESIACFMETTTPGLTITPIKDMLGFRASAVSLLEFENCQIPSGNIVGKPGLALPYVAPYGLHFGRLSTAWSSAGLIRACLQESATYASTRRAFKSLICDHGAVRGIITEMGVNMEASRQLCLNASKSEDNHSPKAMEKTLIAKYFASSSAAQAAKDAVQIRGATGCNEEYPAARYYRDAKVMEIIEGTTEVLQKLFGKIFCKKFNKK